MKKFLTFIALLLIAQLGYAQACSKICTKKNSYVKNGELIEAKLYHTNGVVSQTGFYNSDNKLQGEWISYDTAGNQTAKGFYDNGKKVGTWTFYQGDMIKEVSYNDSRISEVKTWEVTDTRVVSNHP